MVQVLGIVDILWRGVNLPVEKGAKLKLGGIKNKSVVYGRRVGRAQEFMHSEVEAVTHLAKNQSVAEFIDAEEGELQVICDTRQTYVFPDAFLVEQQELTGGEGGKIKLMWHGGNYQEIIS